MLQSQLAETTPLFLSAARIGPLVKYVNKYATRAGRPSSESRDKKQQNFFRGFFRHFFLKKMVYCAVTTCPSKGGGPGWFNVPKDRVRRTKWHESLNLKKPVSDRDFSVRRVVCWKHFKNDQIINVFGSLRLVKGRKIFL